MIIIPVEIRRIGNGFSATSMQKGRAIKYFHKRDSNSLTGIKILLGDEKDVVVNENHFSTEVRNEIILEGNNFYISWKGANGGEEKHMEVRLSKKGDGVWLNTRT